jgi:predicted dehydrogenase
MSNNHWLSDTPLRPYSNRPPPPPSNGPRLRGALLGCGFIAENGHLPAYRNQSDSALPLEIVAVAEPNAARRARAGQLIPGVALYEDADSLLAKEAGRLDYVDIATPPYEHARLAHAAFDKGLHVLCEKPMATTPADARSMLQHARDAKRVFFPCHHYKHAPVVKAVKQVLESGLIGKVNLVTLHTFRNTHAKGVSEWRPDWRREKKYSGGGIAMDHGAHTFYLAFDWLGGYPTAITAKMSTSGAAGGGAAFDTEDNFSCTMTFPEGIASAHLTWTAGVRKVIYTIQGSHGAIRVEDDDVEVAVMASRNASTRDVNAGAAKKVSWELKKEQIASEWMDAGHSVWFRSLFDQFKNAIESREYVGREAEDGVRCIELIATAYASARDGCRELPLGSTDR